MPLIIFMCFSQADLKVAQQRISNASYSATSKEQVCTCLDEPIYLKSSVCFVPFPDFEMKKDIDTLIAEERAEIINKYEKASYILSVVYLLTFCSFDL